MHKDENKAWEFLEELSWKTMQWDTSAEKPATPSTTTKGGIHTVDNSIASEAKLSAVIRRVEALELKPAAQVNNANQVNQAGCNNCFAPNHISEECSQLNNNNMGPSPDQSNYLYQEPKIDPYSSTYNPG
ncbi:hypothetical protein [Paenibacillus apiarius]|uniref:hypothetical protein n=1 Tax=Paenibacillus apiarius TaxID=46240 RepID=UPI003B3B2B25